MLSCLRKALDLVEQRYGETLTLATILAEDPAVYRMLQRADSLGVFQVESRAQMTMLPRLKPANFYDLVIEVAIVRPGPIQGDMVHPYLRRRSGKETVTYPSKELEAVLSKTLGVPLFQEQAMKIAIVAAGFTPAEADKLRRAMATFKRVGTIGSFQRKMIDGMLANGYARDFAERCFHQIEGFGEYGFPESHAASFALLVYASAWLKCRYPDAFAAALLNAQPMGFYAPAQIVRDAREHGVEVRAPDVNHSDWDSTLEPGPRAAERLHELHRDMRDDVRATHALRLGLREIKGFAEEEAQLIVERRARKLRLRARRLAAHGPKPARAGTPRRRRCVRFARPHPARSAVGGQSARPRRRPRRRSAVIFVFTSSPRAKRAGSARGEREAEVHLPPMPLGEEVVNDYRFLRLSLRAHPAQFLRADLAARGIVRNEALRGLANNTRVRISGLVTCRQRPGSAKGVVFMTIEDESAVANVIVWPKVFERVRPVVLGARYVAVAGRVQAESGVIHVVADELEDLTVLLARLAEQGADIDSLTRADEVRRPVEDQREAHALGGRNRLLRLIARNARACRRSRRAGARLGACADAARIAKSLNSLRMILSENRFPLFGIMRYCGTTSPRPTLTRLVSSEPSGFFSARMMATWAPAFSSLLSPTA